MGYEVRFQDIQLVMFASLIDRLMTKMKILGINVITVATFNYEL